MPAGRPRKVNDRLTVEIEFALKRGEPYKSICSRFCIGMTTLMNAARKVGYYRRSRGRSYEKKLPKNDVMLLIQNNEKMCVIAERFGITTSAVSAFARKHGVHRGRGWKVPAPLR